VPKIEEKKLKQKRQKEKGKIFQLETMALTTPQKPKKLAKFISTPKSMNQTAASRHTYTHTYRYTYKFN